MRIRQHVNPLKSDLLSIDVARVPTPPRTGFLEVELGSGEAHFLMERARAEPRGTFVGVEIRREMVDRANRECERAGLSNVRSVFANMSTDMDRLFAPGSVRRFHVNFPDPWWKSKQRKRRVVGPALVDAMARALIGDGEVVVATDIFDIALDAMACLEHAAFRNVAGPWSFLSESRFAARSRRERQCEAEGSRIWRLHYQRSPGTRPQ